MSYYPIELDKVRNLRYGMRALHLIEQKLKKPIAQVDMDNLTMEDMAMLIWAGLQHEDKKLTPDKVMDLVDDHSNLQTIMVALAEAFTGAFGAVEEDAAAVEAVGKAAEMFLENIEQNEPEKND